MILGLGLLVTSVLILTCLPSKNGLSDRSGFVYDIRRIYNHTSWWRRKLFRPKHSRQFHIKFHLTRMHSSRMRTGRSLTVCWSLLPGGGVSAPRGSAWSRGYIPACTEADTPPSWTDTRLWKYYLGPTSLRPVINKHSLKHEKVTSCYLYTLQNITLYFNDKCILTSHEI